MWRRPKAASFVLARNKAHVLALNTAHVLRLNKADVLALNMAHVLRLNSKMCPAFRANTKENTIVFSRLTIVSSRLTIVSSRLTIVSSRLTIVSSRPTIASQTEICLSRLPEIYNFGYESGPRGSPRAHIKSGRSHAHQEALETPPGPVSTCLGLKNIKKRRKSKNWEKYIKNTPDSPYGTPDPPLWAAKLQML